MLFFENKIGSGSVVSGVCCSIYNYNLSYFLLYVKRSDYRRWRYSDDKTFAISRFINFLQTWHLRAVTNVMAQARACLVTNVPNLVTDSSVTRDQRAATKETNQYQVPLVIRDRRAGTKGELRYTQTLTMIMLMLVSYQVRVWEQLSSRTQAKREHVRYDRALRRERDGTRRHRFVTAKQQPTNSWHRDQMSQQKS